ncbi:MAG TPA: biopolymer transporter ExbD, partial [Bryobacteraceae bacterium]|nr:biopolymer transporter ExbD [Bryobacteraceae bacterium]
GPRPSRARARSAGARSDVAFSLNGGNGNGRRGRFRSGSAALSEINVVPLVDVVLVLLIIFMITAHVMEIGLEVEVPKVTQTQDTTKDLPVITLTREGESWVADKPVNLNLLGQYTRQRFPTATEVYVRADRNTAWDPIAQVISKLGEAKYKVNVVTQPADEAPRRRR